MLIAREVAIVCRLGVEVISLLCFISYGWGCLYPFDMQWFFLVIFQVAIVVGGRNFFCGDTWVTATGLDRSTAYQIG